MPDIIGLQEVIDCPWSARQLHDIGYEVIPSLSPRPYRELLAINPRVFTVASTEVIKFPRSLMGRELLIAKLHFKGPEGTEGTSIHVGVSHLESTFQMKEERLRQLSTVFRALETKENSFFLADTNLNMDAALKLGSGWVDMFVDAGSPAAHKYTYASKNNPHITIGPGKRNISKRYDRIFRHGDQYGVKSFKLFGTADPQSDHYGVLVECTVT